MRDNDSKIEGRKPNYGVYDPYLILILSILTILLISILLIIDNLIVRITSLLFLFVSFFFLFPTIFGSTNFAKMRLREKIINVAQPKENDVILDVGTGRGLHAIGFAKFLKKCKVIGVDIWSQTSVLGNRIENALENAKIEGVSDKVEFKNVDARKLPFPDEYFDVVICSFVLHNIRKEWRKALKEMIRVLKTNGKLVINEISYGPFSKKNMTEALEELSASDSHFHSWGFGANIISAVKTHVYRQRDDKI
jgi:ubiquinone/menaquinone biosynthesis C-methylase UbiE